MRLWFDSEDRQKQREDERRQEEKLFGDVVYETWRSGHNPDSIDRDDVREHVRDEGDVDRFVAAHNRKENTARQQQQQQEEEQVDERDTEKGIEA